MHKKLLVLVVLGIILVGGGVFVWYMNEQNQVIVPSSVIVPEVNNKEAYPQHIEAISGSDEVWYGIPEIGVRMRLNKEFAEDLIYQYVHEVTDDSKEEWDATYFSTKALTAIDNGCSPERGSPLGVIAKLGKDAQESAKNNNEYFFSRPNSIYIGDDYYVWTGPQATCWDPKNDDAIMKSRSPQDYRGSGSKYVSDGFKTIQSIPSK